AATTISVTYRSASSGESGVPSSRRTARSESTRAACTHSSSAGSLASYARPVTSSTPRTRVWIRRTRAAACSAAARSPKVIVVTYAEVAASLPTGSRRQPLCWSTPAIASGCSACIISDRRPATGPPRSPLILQVTLAGPKKPSSAGCSCTPATDGAADRSISPAAVAYDGALIVISGRSGWQCRTSYQPNYTLPRAAGSAEVRAAANAHGDHLVQDDPLSRRPCGTSLSITIRSQKIAPGIDPPAARNQDLLRWGRAGRGEGEYHAGTGTLRSALHARPGRGARARGARRDRVSRTGRLGAGRTARSRGVLPPPRLPHPRPAARPLVCARPAAARRLLDAPGAAAAAGPVRDAGRGHRLGHPRRPGPPERL